MIPYLALYTFSALAALTIRPQGPHRASIKRPSRLTPPWLMVFLSLSVLIGFRFEVGGDWFNYQRFLRQAMWMGFVDIPLGSDPAYWFINILSAQINLGITGVNLIGGVLFSAGLVVYCKSLPRPWVALSCAIPYLVIVVAMGYTRQSIAIGLSMIGFVYLARGQLKWFLVWVFLGALFHKSAVILLPLAGFVVPQHRVISFFLVILSFWLAYETLLSDSLDRLMSVYVDKNIVSEGAMIRLAMNAFPAGLFLTYNKRFILSQIQRRFYTIISILSLCAFAAFFVTNLSTALDRLALFMIPLQLFVFAHLPDAIGRIGAPNQAIIFAILMYYFLVLFVWLTMGVHSAYWLPYRMGFA